MRASRVSRPRRSAFTLVELLVSLVVLAILVTLLSSSFNQMSNAWTRSEGNIEVRRNARALTDFISSELKGAMIPIEGVANVRGGNLQFLHNLLPGGNPSAAHSLPDEFRNGDALFWQAPLATDATFGEIAEIGYFVKWVEVEPGTPQRPVLCRWFVNPSAVNGKGEMTLNPDFLIYNDDPAAWLTPTLLDNLAPANKDSAYRGLFAENVLGFWVRCFDLDGKLMSRSFDSRKGYNYQFPNPLTGARDSDAPNIPHYLPARVEISLAQLDSRTAVRFSPLPEQLRELSSDESVRSADQFLARVTAVRELAPLLPGIRIHSTVVQLENAR